MKKIFLAGVLASMILSVRAQSTSQDTQNSTVPPNLPPGLEKRDQLPPGLENRDELPPGLQKRVGIDGSMTITSNMVTTNNIGAQPQNTGAQLQLPPTGLNSGTVTNQAGMAQTGSGQLRIQAVTATDQPIATQVQQVLTAEPVLVQTLPGLNIQVNGGVVILSGDVQCGAESVLVQNLIYQKLPRTVQIQNRLKLNGAMAPAYLSR